MATNDLSEIPSLLNQAYDNANEHFRTLSGATAKDIEHIVSVGENHHAFIAVFTTLAVYKLFCPAQDIRNHQQQLSPEGEPSFSGRSIDTKYITPWLKQHDFPSMATSGWLTRSFEQKVPYRLDYTGSIKPQSGKEAFLRAVDYLQNNPSNTSSLLEYLMYCLKKQRDTMSTITLTKPRGLSIAKIIQCLDRHFNGKYGVQGSSRLPVLALYAAYQCMSREVDRYRDKTLLPLASHTSADLRSGRIGDIDINDHDGQPFEGVEVKHLITITPEIVREAFEKFRGYSIDRYYILTTANMDSADQDAIDGEVNTIAKIHGCQVIVNGVYSSLRYYLRLLSDTTDFTDAYVELLKTDPSVRYAQKEAWNTILNDLV